MLLIKIQLDLMRKTHEIFVGLDSNFNFECIKDVSTPTTAKQS
jgi:hypothetical protein